MVVQNIDAEEEDDVDQPSTNRNLVWCEEERRPRPVELSDISSGGDKAELHKCQEGSW